MKAIALAISTLAIFTSDGLFAAERPQMSYLVFPPADAFVLGQIDKLSVAVSCGRIVALTSLPELYNISVGYEIPAENVLERSLGLALRRLICPNGAGSSEYAFQPMRILGRASKSS
jgi:hypothetical protein